MEASALKQTLAANTTSDESTNQIRMRLSLLTPPAGASPEFILAPGLDAAFTVLHDHNEQVKIYLHGNQTEAALNSITVSGSRNQVNYNLPPSLKPYQGQKNNFVSLQWSWDESGKMPNHQSTT